MTAGFDVHKVARLARLGLSADEEARFAREFESILSFVAQVQALPLDDVPARVHALSIPLRRVEDAPAPGLDRARALAEAPAHRDGFVEVPRILPGSDS